MFSNKNLTTTNNRNDRFLNPWSQNYDPFFSLRDEILDLFDDFTPGMNSLTERQFVPKIEIEDRDDAYVLSAEVPGMSDKDLNITVRDNNLILEGEKKEEHRENKKGRVRSELSYGSFYRVIPLTEDIDPDKINAHYANGILKVTVEKRPEVHSKVKKIPIQSMKTLEGKAETDKKH